MTIAENLLIFGSAVLAGGLNGIAGGGSFISFPTLVFLGIPPINANATNTVALWPGTLASIGAYRHELATQKRDLIVMGSIGLVGGILGALLLLNTSQTVFVKLIPYLLLLATLLFTFSKPITAWVISRRQKFLSTSKLVTFVSPLLQLIIAIYGGFFGGGMGILLLATLAIMGMENINTMNALKTVLTALINGIALIPFILAGIVVWEQAAFMAVGASLGGYLSAHYAQKMQPILVRRFVILVGFSMTLYFFIR